ncbi:TPA: NYN domain-containing protein [Escherichia coli]
MASMETEQQPQQTTEQIEVKTKRVQCFIDGYNLYHAIEETGNKALHWVDLKSLCKRYLPKNASIDNVFWFSAKPSHLSRAINENYQNYASALTECGVDIIGGRFKKKNVTCEADHGCGGVFHKHEEKESDVNLAISLVSGACNDEYDIAIIITADSDLCPPIKYVRERFPNKELWLVAPPGRIRRATDLCSLSSRSMEINNGALRACCMRDEFYKGGVLVARRPQEWRAVANTKQRRARSR